MRFTSENTSTVLEILTDATRGLRAISDSSVDEDDDDDASALRGAADDEDCAAADAGDVRNDDALALRIGSGGPNRARFGARSRKA